MEHVTFWDLFRSLAHWEFEIFMIILLDIVIGILIWPRVKRFFIHHKADHDKLTELENRVKLLESREKSK